MFNVIERHQKLVKGLMITITATFVIWGISGYFGMMGDDGYVAKVGSSKIYTQEIDQASTQNPQQKDKMQILFGLINRQLLLNSIKDNNLLATTNQLQDAIMAIPEFQTNNVFDLNKYQNFLKQRYITSAKFEQEVDKQILINTVVDFYKNSYFSSDTFKSNFIKLLDQERNVSQFIINPKDFYTKINVTESDINNYYNQNIAKFTIPDQVKIKYIQLSVDSLANTIKVSDSEINKYLLSHPTDADNKQIDVSHILFIVPESANSTLKLKIKDKALNILAQLKNDSTKFTSFAKKYSEDVGSANNGGDLGYFGHGSMTKPFEDVAFSLKKGQISGLVKTKFGYHILKLNNFRLADAKSLRAEIISKIQQQKAHNQLQVLLGQLNDITYNESNSLTNAEIKTGLPIQQSDWIDKNTTQGQFANLKLQQAIFSDDVIKQHHNSEVIDLGDGNYIVARAIDYHSAKIKALEAVHNEIIDTLKLQMASQMASQLGQQELAQLNADKLKLNFSGNIDLSLLNHNKDIDPSVIHQIFSVPLQKIPAYTGANNSNGEYIIYRINSQTKNENLDVQSQKFIDEMNSQYALLTLNAYVGSLRSSYKINYKLDRIKNN